MREPVARPFEQDIALCREMLRKSITERCSFKRLCEAFPTHNIMAIVKTVTTFGGQAGNESNGGVSKNGFTIALAASLDFTPDVAGEILSEGFRSLLYRGGASHVLSAYPKGTKATDIVYETDKCGEIKTTLEKWFADKCPNKRGVAYLDNSWTVTIDVSEYEIGEGATPKFARVKAFVEDWLKGKEGRTVVEFATKRSLPMPIETGAVPAVAAVEADEANGVEAEAAVPAQAAKTWKDDMEFLSKANDWYVAKLAAMAKADD